jgi:hypothetical protein
MVTAAVCVPIAATTAISATVAMGKRDLNSDEIVACHGDTGRHQRRGSDCAEQ